MLPSHATIRAGSRTPAAFRPVYAGGVTVAETVATAGGSIASIRWSRLRAGPARTR